MMILVNIGVINIFPIEHSPQDVNLGFPQSVIACSLTRQTLVNDRSQSSLWLMHVVYIHDVKDLLKYFNIDHAFLVSQKKLIRFCVFDLLNSVPELLHENFRDFSRDSDRLVAGIVLDDIDDNLKRRFLLWYSSLQSHIGGTDLDSFLSGNPLFITSSHLTVISGLPVVIAVWIDLTPEEKERYEADIHATNILLQGLPKDIYTLINHYTNAKDILDDVNMLLEGSEITKDKRESQLYDDFEHFCQNKGETIYEYYDRFVTAIKLNRSLKTFNYDQMYAYLKQHEAHANENKMMLERYNQHAIDPLAFVSNISPQQYTTQSSAILQSAYVLAVTHQPQFVDNTKHDS
ncbi:hypothetical protein Tco_0938487 [Tanacetum coccineum]|uniref:Uncharacterized protein n=1 Tax=Tanacetum coccineum TaxID=301880 RepID=A0ABQ5DHZ2_9ASTR